MNKTFFLINFSLSILAAFGISSIKKDSRLDLKPSLLLSSVILGMILGLLICQYLLLNYKLQVLFAVSDIENSLKNINISLRNLVLPSLIIISVLILTFIYNKLNRFHLFFKLIFILLLIFELFRFGLKFNTFSTPDFIYPETPITQFFEKYSNDRFLAEQDTLPSNMWVPFKMSSIAGYDGIYPRNIAQLLATANSGNVDAPPQTRWGILQNFNSKIIDETNTRFLIALKRNNKGQIDKNGQVDNKLLVPKFKEVFTDKGVAILENTEASPRAYITKNVAKALDKEALKLMIDVNFPIKSTSISDFEWINNSVEELQSAVTYTQVTNSHVKINTTSNIDAYLVVLDSYYPGWKALIDGKETTIHKTNYNFRGIVLPKGTHTVDFIYDPQSLKYGVIISGISLLLILSLIFIPRFRK